MIRFIGFQVYWTTFPIFLYRTKRTTKGYNICFDFLKADWDKCIAISTNSNNRKNRCSIEEKKPKHLESILTNFITSSNERRHQKELTVIISWRHLSTIQILHAIWYLKEFPSFLYDFVIKDTFRGRVCGKLQKLGGITKNDQNWNNLSQIYNTKRWTLITSLTNCENAGKLSRRSET